MSPTTPVSWQAIAEAKRRSRLSSVPVEWRLSSDYIAHATAESGADLRSIPASCGILTDDELTITETPAKQIVDHLRRRKWSSEAVTVAFCKRAAIAHQLTNCLTEIFFDEAIAAAQAFDRAHGEGQESTPPLAGLPISLKDNFNLMGKDSNLGFVAWINDPMQNDATLVTLLREQGAILYCKTTTPTAMMIAETVSNANGRTLNPLNTKLTPGGSSGGESALLALKGSPLGVGTDIGGSIRIPCAFTGLWGLKPSFGRFPTHGCRSGLAGQEAVMSINGPMCSTFEGLELFAKTVVDAQPWSFDPKCVPIPWTPVADIRLPHSLTVIMIDNNGLVKPTAPVQRAMASASEQYHNRGHRVIHWDASASQEDTDLFARGLTLIESFFGAEGGEAIQNLMAASGEDADWVEGLAKSNLSLRKTVVELWKLQAARTTWAGEMLARFRQLTGGTPFDAIVSPVAAEVATTHDAYHHIFYTGVWNLLDMPSVVFPLPDHSVDHRDSKPTNTHRNDIEAKVWDQYNSDDIQGMPLCLQVVGYRLQEERTLAVARQLGTNW